MRQTNGSASGKADEGPRESTVCVRTKKMGTVMGKTQACAISTVAWFFGGKRVAQTAARVEQVSEWISMWRGFNVDTKRRIRKVWRKKVPILARDGTKLQVQSLPTICSVLEVGWKPSTPGFSANTRRQCLSGQRFVQQSADQRQFLQ